MRTGRGLLVETIAGRAAGRQMQTWDTGPTPEEIGEAVLLESISWLSAVDYVQQNYSALPALSAWGLTACTMVDGGGGEYLWTATAGTSTHRADTAHSLPLGSGEYLFSVELKAGTESVVHFALGLISTTFQSLGSLDLLTGTVSVSTAYGNIVSSSQSIGGGWWRLTVRHRVTSTENAGIRLLMRSAISWTAVGTETVYVRNASATRLAAASCEAPSGSLWEAPSAAAAPAVYIGAGGGPIVGGILAESAVYLQSPVSPLVGEMTISWLAFPSMYFHNKTTHASGDCVVFRGISGSDLLEIGLLASSGEDRWFCRSTISGVPHTSILARGASWATAVISLVFSGGSVEWLVDGAHVQTDTLAIPSGIDTLRAGSLQGGGPSTSTLGWGWDAGISDLAVWNRALSPAETLAVSHRIWERAGLDASPWKILVIAGQSNSATAGNETNAVAALQPLADYRPACRYERDSLSVVFEDSISPRAQRDLSTVSDAIVSCSVPDMVGARWNIQRVLLDALRGRKIFAVNLGANGCPVGPGPYSWDPGSANVFDIHTDRLIAESQKVTGAVVPFALVWVHGESDCQAAGAPLYEGAMVDMLDAWIAKCGSFGRLVVTSLSDSQVNVNNTYKPTIRAAQQAIASHYGGYYVETNGFSVGPDGIHFDETGKVQIGQAVASVLT